MYTVVTFHGAVQSDNLFQNMAITVGAGQTYCTYKRFVKYKYACVSYNTYEMIWICGNELQSAERYAVRSDIPQSSRE